MRSFSGGAFAFTDIVRIRRRTACCRAPRLPAARKRGSGAATAGGWPRTVEAGGTAAGGHRRRARRWAVGAAPPDAPVSEDQAEPGLPDRPAVVPGRPLAVCGLLQ